MNAVNRVNDSDYSNREMAEREKFNYPPYFRLIQISLKHVDRLKVEEAAATLGRELRAVFGNRVFGPEYPMVSRIRNKYINQILLKNKADQNQKVFKRYLKQVLDKFREYTRYRSVLVQIDVDPQ